MNRSLAYILLLILPAFFGCDPDSVIDVPKETEGYRPVYADPAMVKEVRYQAATPVVSAGKIYYKGGYIFQVEQGKGIHVVNASDPSQANRIGFISIIGCQEIAITGNYLFTNNLTDLISVDISDFTQPKVVKRIEKAFKLSTNELPPVRGYFECPDPNKGVVVGWRKDVLKFPKCSNF